MPSRINVVRPSDGKIIGVPTKDIKDYLALGYRLESPDESYDRIKRTAEKEHYSGGMQQFKAGVEGVASGLTMGGYDIVSARLNGEASQKRAEYNSGTRIGGEIVGAILPAFFTGGESLAVQGAAKAGVSVAAKQGAKSILGSAIRATPSAALGTASRAAGRRLAGPGLAGKLAGGAIEGAVFGASSELTHASLSGDPLTTEGILSSAGLGMMFGFGTAGAGAMLEGLGGKAKQAIGGLVGRKAPQLEQDAMAAFQGVSNQADAGYLNKLRAVKEPLPPQKYPDAKSAIDAREAASHGFLPKEQFEELRGAIKDARLQADRLVNEVDRAHVELQKQAAANAKLAASVETPTVAKPAPAAQFDDMAKAGNDLYNRVSASPAGVKAAKKELNSLRARWRWVKAAIKEGNGPKIEQKLAAYREGIENLSKASGMEHGLGAADTAVAEMGNMTQKADAFGSAVSDIEEVAKFGQAVRGIPLVEDPDAWFAMSPDRAEMVFGSLDQVLSNKLPETAGIRRGIEDTLERMGQKAGLVKGDSPMATARQLWAAGKAVREQASEDYLNSAWATQKVRLEGEPRVREAKAQARPKVLPEAVEEAKPIPEAKIAKEKSEHPIRNLIIRAAIGHAVGGPTGMLVGAMMGGRGQAGAKLHSAAGRLARGTGKAMSTVGPRVEPLYHSLSGIPDTEGEAREALVRRSEELRMLATGAGADRAFLTSQALSTAGHPEFAKAAFDVSNRVVQVLMKRLPKSPTGTNWGTDYLWSVPPEQVAVVSQEWQAGTAPADFLDWATGHLDEVFPTAVAVVKEAWPALYSEFQALALLQLSRTGTAHMDHDELVGWSVMLDTTLSPTMDPNFISETAAMHAEPPQEQQSPKGRGGKPSGSANPATAPDATRAQQVEAR